MRGPVYFWIFVLLVLTSVYVTNGLDFNLVYFSEPNKQLIIKNESEFTKIDPIYKRNDVNVFIIHGYIEDYTKKPWLIDLKNIVFKVNNNRANVFIVDWAEKASLVYPLSALFTKELGKQLAGFIAFLHKNYSVDSNKIHLIGHSLGGQAAGFTGKNLKSLNIVASRITALDPAGPGFPTQIASERINKTDAKFVEVIHTNMARTVVAGLGIAQKCGDVDVFLNGGSRQPGCEMLLNANYDDFFPPETSPKRQPTSISGILNFKNLSDISISISDLNVVDNLLCHHQRSVAFYLDTFYKSKSESTCQPVAYRCTSYKDFLDGKCTKCGNKNELCFFSGYYAVRNVTGLAKKVGNSFFLQSNSKKPFCTNHYGVEIKLEKAELRGAEFELTVEGEKASDVFVIAGDWKEKSFRTLITTEKMIGKLIRARGHFKNSSNAKLARLIELKLTYMSNIEESERKKLSASFKGETTGDGNYLFNRV